MGIREILILLLFSAFADYEKHLTVRIVGLGEWLVKKQDSGPRGMVGEGSQVSV